MKYFYSPSANAFYPEEVLDLYSTLPSDLKEVSYEVFERFALAPHDNDHARVADQNGNPTWTFVGLSERQKKEAKRRSMKVSRFQAKAALHDYDLLDKVEGMMEDSNTSTRTKIAWKEASEFQRLSLTVLEMGEELSLSPSALDELFEYAQSITA